MQLLQQSWCDALVARQMHTNDASRSRQSLSNVPKHVFSQVCLAQIQVDQCLVPFNHFAYACNDLLLLQRLWTLLILFLE